MAGSSLLNSEDEVLCWGDDTARTENMLLPRIGLRTTRLLRPYCGATGNTAPYATTHDDRLSFPARHGGRSRRSFHRYSFSHAFADRLRRWFTSPEPVSSNCRYPVTAKQ